MAFRPRYANNLQPSTNQPSTIQPLTFNNPTLAFRPRYANNLQQTHLGLSATLREQPSTIPPWPFGHATRTTFNNSTFNNSTFNNPTFNNPTLAFRPRYANNLQQTHLGLSATLREQPSTIPPWPFGHATRTTFNLGLSATLREQPSTFNKPTFNNSTN
ncbi:MAG: hypothetical protein F6J94_17155 [Moorea sp. SIO1F2]|uniref:hypothetical protein n=1 Tax=Moorena sp. SIO1F2 TaxID=2607819 RepID=UPI0013BDB52D|nr:hypothetical protein [Moorena sp. SIO1F2]NET83585.1 hypothetical protein [Moorena sp. SIO1F2]